MNTTPVQDKVIERVRKLLALAKSDNANEAAIAAARAAEMMETFGLSEALVTGAPTKDPIVEAVSIHTGGRVVHWKGTIAGAAAKAFGARAYYWNGGHIHLLGRQSAVQAATYTIHYLWREVDRLAGEALRRITAVYDPRWSARKFGNSFRLGAANEIARRLHEQRDAQKAARRAELERLATEAPVDGEAPAVRAQQALVRVEADAVEVEEAYKAFSRRHNFKPSSGGRVSSSWAYAEGREAGKRVALGGAKGALGAAAPRLGSGS
jgi:hypothetical protein